MKHRDKLASVLLLCVPSLSLGLGGCEVLKIDHGSMDERATTIAEAYCAAYQACDCAPLATDAVHPDPDSCAESEHTRLLAGFDQAQADGLVFDAGCMDQLVERYDALGCDSIPSLHAALGNPALADSFGCALFHGAEVEGICEAVAGTNWSDCAAGLRCLDGACEPVVSAGPVGNACGFGSEFSLDCEAGLYCDQFDGCQAPAGTDEPCLLAGDGSLPCNADHYCEPIAEGSIEGLCRPLLGAGQPCISGGEVRPCEGRCESLGDVEDPSLGACIDVPAVCLDDSLRPPV